MLPSQIGYYSLILGLFFSVAIIPISILNLRNTSTVDYKIFSFSFLQFLLVFISFGSLIVSFVNSDFSNETVFNNSNTSKPLFYKIAGTWGNHEGSLLLWLLTLTLFIFLFLIKSKYQPKTYRILTLLFQQFIIIGFFLFVLKTSNPFNHIFPVPKEGLGLNPILQDPALAIHPPILYIGYVGSSIIFSSSLAAVVNNYISSDWAKHIKGWILISWIFLTIGIMLGSIWAYYELGWGGFWFWDPVENISLMPWLCLTALLHCIMVLEKKRTLTSWVVVLSIATFTLSMCGTFLVRSGILNSIHTFANDPSRGVFILIFLFVLIGMSIIIFFLFHKENNQDTKNIFFFSKEMSILFNNWFVMYFLSVILIGTVYPIFLEVLQDEKISIGPPFYNSLILPFLIIFLLLISLVPHLSWIKSKKVKIKFQIFLLFILSLFLSLVLLRKIGSFNLTTSILLIASFYLFFITIRDFFSKSLLKYSQKISHFGFSLLVLSILLNSIFSKEVVTNLRIGENFSLNDEIIKFVSIKVNNEKNYQSIKGVFEIIDIKKKVLILEPEIRIYDQPKTVTSEADIKTSLYLDKFLVMNHVEGNDFFNVRYQVKPFMIWIWISAMIIAVGGIFALSKKSYEK